MLYCVPWETHECTTLYLEPLSCQSVVFHTLRDLSSQQAARREPEEERPRHETAESVLDTVTTLHVQGNIKITLHSQSKMSYIPTNFTVRICWKLSELALQFARLWVKLASSLYFLLLDIMFLSHHQNSPARHSHQGTSRSWLPCA